MKIYNAIAVVFSEKIARLFLNVLYIAVTARLIDVALLGVFSILLAVYQLILPVINGGFINAYLVSTSKRELFDWLHAFSISACIVVVALSLVLLRVFDVVSVSDGSEYFWLFLVSLLFLSYVSLHKAHLFSEKKFGVVRNIELTAFLSSVLISLVVIYLGYALLGLVLRYFLESFFLAVAYSLFSGKTKGVAFGALRTLDVGVLKYSYGIVLARLLSTASSTIDRIVLSRFYPIGDVGAFSYLKNIVIMPDSVLRVAITAPAISYISGRSTVYAYKKMMHIANLVLILSIAPCLVIYIAPSQFVALLLGVAWLEYVDLLKALSVYGWLAVLRGWLGVYFINTIQVKKWFYLTLTDFVLMLFVLSVGGGLNADLGKLLTIYVVVSAFYWCGAVFYLVSKFSSDVWSFFSGIKFFVVPFFVFILKLEIDRKNSASLLDDFVDLIGVGISVTLVCIIYLILTDRFLRRFLNVYIYKMFNRSNSSGS